MRLKIGYTCWFKHSDGRIIQGVYREGRRVEQMTAFKRTKDGFEETNVTWTVPGHIVIHGGPAPKLPTT